MEGQLSGEGDGLADGRTDVNCVHVCVKWPTCVSNLSSVSSVSSVCQMCQVVVKWVSSVSRVSNVY